ncbi:MAG: hypothetical protein LAQ69_18640 [Acidobacteriia bacterium]|nr:hypothetical protein [Terriglobia bacterium]
MVTISAKGRVKGDGTLDLHVTTGLPETDVEVLLVLEPLVLENEKAASSHGGWPEGYFEKTFGSLRDNPITYEPPPQYETRPELR